MNLSCSSGWFSRFQQIQRYCPPSVVVCTMQVFWQMQNSISLDDAPGRRILRVAWFAFPTPFVRHPFPNRVSIEETFLRGCLPPTAARLSRISAHRVL